MSDFVFLNGRLVDENDAAISIYDAGLLHGIGLFETMRAYNGRVFRLEDHLERLFSSAATLGIPIPLPRNDLQEWTTTLLQANDRLEARVRLTITRGDLRPATQADEAQVPAGTVFMTASPMAGYPAEYYQRGMTVILLADHKANPTDPTAGHKTLNYFPRLLALQRAQSQGAGEAFWFTPANRLASGSISNVFVVKGLGDVDTSGGQRAREGAGGTARGEISEVGRAAAGRAGALADVVPGGSGGGGELAGARVYTPRLDGAVLGGITRKVVLELCAQQGVTVEETDLVVQDILEADEIFVTNSIMELMPVCQVERHAVGDEKPGLVYRLLHQAYRAAVREECPPRGAEA